MTEWVAVLAGAFFGSAHCIGMCGGLAAAIGATRRPLWPTIGRQLVYTLGRIFTYAFLGAVGGFAGLYLSRYKVSLIGTQQVFSALAGVIMIWVGLSVLGLIPRRRRSTAEPGGLFAPVFAHFLNAREGWGYFVAGMATGFLPCGFVYAFLAMAVATGSVSHGIVLMVCFGLGTAPAMMLVGCGSALVSHTTRLKALRVAACFVIFMGGMMIYRAFPREGDHCCSEAAVSRMGID